MLSCSFLSFLYLSLSQSGLVLQLSVGSFSDALPPVVVILTLTNLPVSLCLQLLANLFTHLPLFPPSVLDVLPKQLYLQQTALRQVMCKATPYNLFSFFDVDELAGEAGGSQTNSGEFWAWNFYCNCLKFYKMSRWEQIFTQSTKGSLSSPNTVWS